MFARSTSNSSDCLPRAAKTTQDLVLLFDALDQHNQGAIQISGVSEYLSKLGLHQQIVEEFISQFCPLTDSGTLTLEEFKNGLMQQDWARFGLFQRALRGSLAIPEWELFTTELSAMFDDIIPVTEGKNASYIPQLDRVPDHWGLAVCTVDGQTWSKGDSKIPYTVQSTSKPITLCMAVEDVGAEKVTRHVGHKPSGKKFNAFELDDSRLPHNPMINAGAIMTCSLLKSELEPSDRLDYVLQVWSDLAGKKDGFRVGFDPATYLSELNTADRNFALAYYMRDEKAFPENTQIQKTLEFYFQCCSIQINAEEMASVAATLASGGICPLTGKRVFQPQTVQNMLSIMFSCGMYDYSGEFAFSIGIPAKSGVSGCIMVVVPNVAGFCTYSPRIDTIGNSVRGIEFCRRLVDKYDFHIFDCVSHSNKKVDPRFRRPADPQLAKIAGMCFAAARGNLVQLQSLVEVSKVPVSLADYDGRTPLHLAACEGRLRICEYLLSKKADPNARDRWGHTPYDDAVQNNQHHIAELLKKAGAETELPQVETNVKF